MKTLFSTGPGFFWAETPNGSNVPKGKMRIHCARIECYELDESDGDLETTFDLLVAKAEDSKEIARSLVSLHDSLGMNIVGLKKQAQ